MNELSVQSYAGQTVFEPGGEISGNASWQLVKPVTKVELRLFWFTSGAGNEDVGIVETIPFDHPSQNDSRPFRFRAPAGPCSFAGRLITLNWALELVANTGKEVGRLDIVIAPGGKPTTLESLPQVKKKKNFFRFGLRP